MKIATELRLLRWAVVTLFAVQIVQFVRTTPSAQAAPPTAPPAAPVAQPSLAFVKPKAIGTKLPPTAAVPDRVAALEAQVAGIAAYNDTLQAEIQDFYNAFARHVHDNGLNSRTQVVAGGQPGWVGSQVGWGQGVWTALPVVTVPVTSPPKDFPPPLNGGNSGDPSH